MPIERITADDLRDMEHQEGLVLQGCGGEAQEWLDGIIRNHRSYVSVITETWISLSVP